MRKAEEEEEDEDEDEGIAEGCHFPPNSVCAIFDSSISHSLSLSLSLWFFPSLSLSPPNKLTAAPRLSSKKKRGGGDASCIIEDPLIRKPECQESEFRFLAARKTSTPTPDPSLLPTCLAKERKQIKIVLPP